MLFKLLTFLGFLALASSVCVLQKLPEMADDEVMALCFFAKDLKAEMAKIPTDKKVVAITIVESEIPKIETGTFERFGSSLKKLAISYSGLKDIEEHAFKGLTSLAILILRNNELEKVKSSWFNDLTSLVEIDLNNNKIENTVDPDVMLANLQTVDIGNNKIKCLKLDLLDKMKSLKIMKSGMNPMTWKCMIEFEDWKKNHTDITYDWSPSSAGLSHLLDVVRECLKTTDGEQETMDTCVDTKMNAVAAK